MQFSGVKGTKPILFCLQPALDNIINNTAFVPTPNPYPHISLSDKAACSEDPGATTAIAVCLHPERQDHRGPCVGGDAVPTPACAEGSGHCCGFQPEPGAAFCHITGSRYNCHICSVNDSRTNGDEGGRCHSPVSPGLCPLNLFISAVSLSVCSTWVMFAQKAGSWGA